MINCISIYEANYTGKEMENPEKQSMFVQGIISAELVNNR